MLMPSSFRSKTIDMAPSVQVPMIFDDATRGSPTKPSVLRSIWSSKGHRRNQSADDAAVARQSQGQSLDPSFVTPRDQAYATLNQPLAEIIPNRDADDLSFQRSPGKQEKNTLHKKTKSAVSLKSLKSYMERKDQKTDEPPPDESSNLRPKKAKSANSLTAILKRSQGGRKSEDSKSSGDKENQSPTDLGEYLSSPPWNRYPNDSFSHRGAAPQSPGKRRTFQEEVSLYTPKGYSPAQQRNFHDFQQPSLSSRTGSKPRPKSDFFAGGRKVKDFFGSSHHLPAGGPPSTDQADSTPFRHGRPRGLSGPAARPEFEQRPEQSPKRVSRVQAAISAFNAKEHETELKRRLNAKDLESEFEKLLVRPDRHDFSRLLEDGEMLTAM